MRAILVADDDPGVAEAFRQYLQRALGDDWSVTVELTGEGALSVVAAGGLDVVLTDYDLGDMNATELIGRALAVAPGLRGRFIVCSGYPFGQGHPLFTEMGCHRLDKPFALEELQRVVDEVVDG